MSKRKRILIAEDEDDLSWALAKNFSKSNPDFEIECAGDGNQASALLRKKKFDLVISDIRLPGRDGVQLALEIRRRYPHIKIILMTAYGSEEMLEKADKLGTYFYIEKPFEVGYLKQIIHQALGLRKSGLKGLLKDAAMRELVELNCLNKNWSQLQVVNKSKKGKIYFKEGDVVHAECGELQGERAFYNMLNWGEGSFEVKPSITSTSRTILRDWKSLLHQSI